MGLHRIVLCGVGGLALVVGASGARAASTPITSCGQTATTNAALTQNLDCTGTGIIVGAPGITIDLKGFVVKGNRSSNHFGIDDTGGFTGITVKNGVLRNFDDGVNATNGADKITLANLVTSGNSTFGIFVAGDFASIKSATAAGNSGGIFVDGASASVKSSNASGNVAEGIDITGDSARVASSTASGNGGAGIAIEGATAAVKSSTAAGDGGPGISIMGASASIKSTTTIGNVGGGISVEGNLASIKSSVATGNANDGIFVDGDGASLNGNRADGNGFAGGTSDLNGGGIHIQDFTTPPVGKNETRGNDSTVDCFPPTVCGAD